MPDTTVNLNLVRLAGASQARAVADATFADRPFRLALAGYGRPKVDTYEPHTRLFVKSVIDRLGSDKVGMVTSPTEMNKQSIDIIGITLAQQGNIPLLFATAEHYLPWIDLNQLPESVNKAHFINTPKYVFPSKEEYSEATAIASNALLLTGGADATVGDFVNAVREGNQVVILDNETLGGVNWNTQKQSPFNASRYLVEQLEANQGGKALPWPECNGFSPQLLAENARGISEKVFVIALHHESEISEAATRAARFISKHKHGRVIAG